jgi:hypothetical protein
MELDTYESVILRQSRDGTRARVPYMIWLKDVLC